MSNARELTSAALLLSLATVASRLLGFVREMVIAASLGAGSETDAYLAAFAIPDVINHFLAGGALTAALLPIFAKHLVAGDPERAWLLVSRVLSAAGIVLLIALGIGAIATEPILRFAYPGFDESQIALTARLTRIILPGPLLFTFGAIINATEQARKRFVATALTGLVYNACIIAGGLLGARHLGVEGFSWGVVAGAALGPFLIPIVFS
ncbi:MAG: putative peptidoglycan lipid II flippase, partial [Bradymonadia bacterium]